MNPGPTPPSPDDEARDPLLAVLQQRLGDYGQAPPPGAWGAIRQQLPQSAAPQYWRRRPRRLLPLLALLLGLVAVGTLAVHQAQLRRGSQALGRSQPRLQGTLNKPFVAAELASRSKQQETPSALAHAAAAASSAIFSPAASPEATSGAATTVTSPRATQAHALAKRSVATTPASSKGTYNSSKVLPSASVAGQKGTALNAGVKELVRSRHRTVAFSQLTRSDQRSTLRTPLGMPRATTRTGRGQHQAVSQAALIAQAASTLEADTLTNTTESISGNLARTHHLKVHGARPLLAALPPSGHQAEAISVTNATRDKRRETKAIHAVVAKERSALSGPLDGFDSLAIRPVLLGLLPALPSPTLVAQPDSTKPLPPIRRWSLLVVAGPTLSYRTLGPIPAEATAPRFARLERPALGLGAQVQVRRVLSGRWAVAVGLGYQEYATQLALRLKDTAYYASVHQRDSYRLLTLPVQFGYALGVPRGRLATALLVGAEPGLYVGGRSTEGSGCGCEQQVYTSAAASPYRTWNLAFSLGLDLRYHVGGPASRWQWLVQPTARYVLTPFVRSEALGYARRRPFSLGLLTGFSWDLR